MPSITPSPPYMPPQPRDLPLLSKHPPHRGGLHPHKLPPQQHAGLHHATPLSSHGGTPHSTLQSTSSNQSSSQGGSSSGGHNKSGGRLNISAMSSKHSVGGNSGSVSPGTTGTGTRTTGLDQSRDNSHLTDLSHISHLTPKPPHPLHSHISHPSLLAHPSHHINNSNTSSITSHITTPITPQYRHSNGILPNSKHHSPIFLPTKNFLPPPSSSPHNLLNTLGLLCLISLLSAILALSFLLKLTPPEPLEGRGQVVQEVTLAIAALTLALDLFCVLVCAAQYIFASKLKKESQGGEERAAKYLRQSSVSRVCAITGFFVSVPLLLGGVVVHTFLVLHSVPAILTSAFIGLCIVLCGAAMIHNVVLWQKHKRRSTAQTNPQNSGGDRHQNPLSRPPHTRPSPPHHLHSTSSPLPPTTVDLSATMNPVQELSTLV